MYLRSKIVFLVCLDQPVSQVTAVSSHADDHLLSAPFPTLRPCFEWFSDMRHPVNTAGLMARAQPTVSVPGVDGTVLGSGCPHAFKT